MIVRRYQFDHDGISFVSDLADRLTQQLPADDVADFSNSVASILASGDSDDRQGYQLYFRFRQVMLKNGWEIPAINRIFGSCQLRSHYQSMEALACK